MKEKETSELEIHDLSYLEAIISQRQDVFMHKHVGMQIERGFSLIVTIWVSYYHSPELSFKKGYDF